MPFEAASGNNNGVTFTPDGFATVVFAIREWSWAEAVDKVITTHSQSQGVQAVIAGILSGDGDVQADYDLNNPPHGPGLIRAGTKGTIRKYVTPTKYFAAHVMIERVNYKSVVGGKVEVGFTVTLDSTSGAYVYPA